MAHSPVRDRRLRSTTGAAVDGVIPRQRTPATARPGGGSPPTEPDGPDGPDGLDGLGQVAALVRDGFAGLPHTHRSPRRALIWAFWSLGIVGDGATTLAMVSSGEFAEANPAAAVGMGFLGLQGYVVLASVICVFFAVVSTGRPRGPVAGAAVGFLLLVAAGKLFMALSNLTLWASVR